MGQLYERILSDAIAPNPPRLSLGHWFEDLMGEYGAGDITGPAVTAAFEQLTGLVIADVPPMGQEILDLVESVTNIPVPAIPNGLTKPNPPAVGANVATVRTYSIAVSDYAEAASNRAVIAAARAEGLALRAHKIRRIKQILTLATRRTPITGYDTPAALRTRLGVPTR